MAELELKNISVSYKDKKVSILAVDNVSCKFLDGTITVILGASGCGKTTLLRTIIGLLPYNGDIYLDDLNIANISIQDRNFAYVNQNIGLQPHLTIFDNIAYPLRIKGVDKKIIVEKVNDVAEKLGIKACLTRKPKHISIGQAQRVAIARALIKQASVYFFDEPFSNLDLQRRVEGRKLLKEFKETFNITMVYVTHSIQEALSLGDNIIVMDEGHIVFEGTPEKLLESDIPEVKGLVEAENE